MTINLNTVRCVDNRTTDREELERLAASIGNLGLLQPILLREIDETAEKQGYEVVDGRRRYRALMLLERYELDEADYRVIDTEDPELISFVANVERKDLSLWEEVDQFSSLGGKYSVAELAQLLGRSEKYVRIRLKLSNLAPEIRRKAAKYPTMTIDGWSTVAAYPVNCQLEIPDWWFNYNVRTISDELERKFAHRLELALFDVAGCAGCLNRSDTEPWLFEELKDKTKVRCLDSACWEKRRIERLKELAAEAVTDGLRLVATAESEPPKTFKKMTYIVRNSWELPPACPKEKADAFVFWGCEAGRYCKLKEDKKSEKAAAAEPAMTAEERNAAKARKTARLRFASAVAKLEKLPPRPDAVTLVKLQAILGIGWVGEHYELRDLDDLEAAEVADKVWCKCIAEFGRRAGWAKQATLAEQDDRNDRVAARLLGIDWSEFEKDGE